MNRANRLYQPIASDVKPGQRVKLFAMTNFCGLTIGERAAVGAGSVVTKDVPADTVVAGNPACLRHPFSPKFF